MQTKLDIPNGNEFISIKLTVKEALAIGTGVKFAGDPKLVTAAKKKVRESIENKLMAAASKSIDYHLLEM